MIKVIRNQLFFAVILCLMGFVSCEKDPLPPEENRVVPSDGLLLYLPFNGDVKDYSGNEHHGTFVREDNMHLEVPLFEDGIVGQSLKLNETKHEWVTIPSIHIETLTQFSINVWAKISKDWYSSYYNYYNSFFQHGVSNTNFVAMGYYQDSYSKEFYFTIGDFTTSSIHVPYDSVYQNQWTFFTFNYKDGQAQAYINGQKVGTLSKQISDQDIVSLADAYYFLGAGFHKTSIDEFRFYTRALTEAEIAVLYSEGKGVPTVPQVSTGNVSNVAAHTAKCAGSVSENGGVTAHNRGICWSTSREPSIDQHPHTNNGYGSGDFTGEIIDLEPDGLYYARAYAVNRIGTAYGNLKAFYSAMEDGSITGQSCPGLPTVTYDGYVYHTVKIGTQCWLRENLRNTHYADGTPIALGSSSIVSNEIPYRYAYGDDPANVDIYGYLYNRAAMLGVNGKDICPNGWKVPAYEEIGLVFERGAGLIGGSDLWRDMCAEASYPDTYCAPGNYSVGYVERNLTNFTALPAGLFDATAQNYVGINSFAIWQISNPNPSVRSMHYNGVTSQSNNSDYATSIRCVKQ